MFGQLATVDPASFTIRFAPNSDIAYFAFGSTVATGSWHLIPDVVDFTGLDLAAVITTGAWSVTLIGHLSVGGVAMALAIQVGSARYGPRASPDGTKTFPGIVELANWFSSGTTLGPQTQNGFGDLGLDPSVRPRPVRGPARFDVAAAKVVSLEIDSELTIVGLELDLVLLLPEITLAGSLAQPGVRSSTCSAGQSSPPPACRTPSPSSGELPRGRRRHVQCRRHRGRHLAERTGAAGADQRRRLLRRRRLDRFVRGTAGHRRHHAWPFRDLRRRGWIFAGRTLPGSSASIGALIDDLSTEFGIGTVPAALKSLTLTDLQVSYTTATGTFDFACTCTLDVEDTHVTLVATINVTTSSGQDKSDPSVVVGSRGYSAKFGGTITFDDLQFDLIFDLTDDNADIFVADYVAITDPPDGAEGAGRCAVGDAGRCGAVRGQIDLQEVKFCFYKKTATLWTFGLRRHLDRSQPAAGRRLPPAAGAHLGGGEPPGPVRQRGVHRGRGE